MIESVTIMPAPSGTEPSIVVQGDLGALLGLDQFQEGAQIGGGVGSGGRI